VELFFITPYELPAEVLHARVIDTDGYLYTFNTLDQTAPDPDSVNKWTDVTFGGSVHFNKVKNRRSSSSSAGILILTKNLRNQRCIRAGNLAAYENPASHTWHGDIIWYDNMTFGLSPGGKVKVWFPDVEGRPSIPVKPLKMWTLSGNAMTLCKDYVVPGGSFNFIQSTQDFIKGKTYPYGNWD
jgi:hypothetical protein